jgi:hypothetical protein
MMLHQKVGALIAQSDDYALKSARFHFSEKRRLRHLSPDRKEMTLTTKASEERSTAARARAEASFKKEERAKDGALAMTEYLANARMIRERTERLRALRLAKEEADKEREVPAAANKSKSAKKR